MIEFERGKYKFTLQIKNNGLVLKYYIRNSNYKWIDVTTYYTGINRDIVIDSNTRFNIYLTNTKFNPYGTKLINLLIRSQLFDCPIGITTCAEFKLNDYGKLQLL